MVVLGGNAVSKGRLYMREYVSSGGRIELVPCFAAPPLWNDMQIQDTVRKGVVFLGWKEGDKFSPKATGFIMRAQEGDFLFGYIVTAQHCVGKLYEPDEMEGLAMFDRVSTAMKDLRLSWRPNIAKLASSRPGTKCRCSCAARRPRSQRIYDYTWGAVEQFIVTEALIQEKKIGVGDEVAVVGLFRNHAGRKRNIPIVRIGNIAAMRRRAGLDSLWKY